MKVKEIVAAQLALNGFDGLYNNEGCGCQLSELLGECGNTENGDCKPGYFKWVEDGRIIGPHEPPEPDDE